MSTFKLDDLRNDLDSKFNVFKIEVGDQIFTFRSVMRMDKKDRAKIKGCLEQFQEFVEDDSKSLEDAEPVINEMIVRAVSDGKGKDLVKILDGDITLTLYVVSEWVTASNPGEASGSPDSSTTTVSNFSATSDDTTD